MCAGAGQAAGEPPWGRRAAEHQGAGLWVPKGARAKAGRWERGRLRKKINWVLLPSLASLIDPGDWLRSRLATRTGLIQQWRGEELTRFQRWDSTLAKTRDGGPQTQWWTLGEAQVPTDQGGLQWCPEWMLAPASYQPCVCLSVKGLQWAHVCAPGNR